MGTCRIAKKRLAVFVVIAMRQNQPSWVATATLARKRAIRATDCTGVFLQRIDVGSTDLYVRAFGKAAELSHLVVIADDGA
jgi:hypothetical protein